MKSLCSWILLIGAVGILGIVSIQLIICPPGPTAKEVRAEADFRAISASLAAYHMAAGHYPPTEQGFEVLLAKPEDLPRPQHWKRLADRMPRDPWETAYRYRALPEGGEFGFEIISAGRDGKFGTKDDLTSTKPR